MNENRDIPLRVRITTQEAERFQQAMDKLGITSRSVYVRWALENSTVQVLGRPVAAPTAAPARAPRPAPVKAVVVQVEEPRLPTLTDLFGAPSMDAEATDLTDSDE